MIGGRRPLKGRKPADRRIRIERPHSAFFRYAGPGQLVAKPAAHRPKTPRRAGVGARQGRASRPTPGFGRGDRRAAVQEEGAADLQLRRDQLVGLCDRGDPARPGPRWDRGCAALLPARGRRDRPAPCGRGRLVPPGVPGVPQRRWRVLGVEGEPRGDRQPGGRRRPAHRLRDDGVRLDRLGDRPGVLGHPERVRLPRRGGGARDRSHHYGEPTRPARVGQHLRRPDLPLRGPGPDHGRDRDIPRRDGPGLRHRPARRGPAGHRGHRPVPAAEGVRQRLGRAHRDGGDRQRRPSVQAARSRRTRPTP